MSTKVKGNKLESIIYGAHNIVGHTKIVKRLKHLEFQKLIEVKRVLDWLAPKGGEKIIDIGSGDGYYSSLIASTGAEVHAIDKTIRYIKQARKFYKSNNLHFYCENSESLSFPNQKFDKAVSICVMEHVNNDRQIFREINRVLKPKGVLVMSLDSLSGKEFTPIYKNLHKGRFLAKRFYNHKNISKKLSSAGFEIERLEYVYTTPISIALAKISHTISLQKRSAATYHKYIFGSVPLSMLGMPVSLISERFAKRSDEGLTLVVKAKKTNNS